MHGRRENTQREINKEWKRRKEKWERKNENQNSSATKSRWPNIIKIFRLGFNLNRSRI